MQSEFQYIDFSFIQVICFKMTHQRGPGHHYEDGGSSVQSDSTVIEEVRPRATHPYPEESTNFGISSLKSERYR